jgi:hypothetical protein
MNQSQNLISAVELRRLLVDLIEKRPDISIRIRILGRMWKENFMKITLVTEKGVILNDEIATQMINVNNLNDIIQFEIDNGFQNYPPHFHFDLQPSVEFL